MNMAQRMRATLATAAILIVCAGQTHAQAPPPLPQNAKADLPAATVNGEAVSMAEVKAILEQRPSPVPLTAAQQRELRLAAVEMLIDDVLMRQFLRKEAPPATAAEIDKEMGDLKDALKKQSKSLEQFLRESKQSPEQLQKDVVARLQWKHYLLVRFPEPDVKSYYEVNKMYFDKIFVRASHILIKLPQNATPLERQAAKDKLEALRSELVADKRDFAEAAKKISDCPSKDKGGDLGSFPYKFVVVEPFAKTAFAMQVGEISNVVATEFGLHLIKVTERTAGESSHFELQKGMVREVMAQDQELYNRILVEERKTAKIDILLQ